MSDSKQKYFNFPISLISSFLENHKECLKDIYDFATYAKCLSYVGKRGFEWLENLDELHKDDIESLVSLTDRFFRRKTGNKIETFKNGKLLYDSIPESMPKVGLNLNIFWDYYENDKTEFDKVCLLAFLSIKSILQNKAYCKITNKYMLARMLGESKSLKDESELLGTNLFKYRKRYHLDKLKSELELNWGLKYYSRHTRGFYVSFKLSLEDLIFQAEKKRKSTLKKQKEFEKKNALQRALRRLENDNK